MFHEPKVQEKAVNDRYGRSICIYTIQAQTLVTTCVHVSSTDIESVLKNLKF